MLRIDETRLESDLAYRFQYLADFMDFGPRDVEAIHAAAPLLAPLVDQLVDAVYEKLHQRDATWRHFLPRQFGFDGPTPAALNDLTMDHEQIRYRKAHLARYLTGLVTKPYDAKMVGYLDMVGKIHTSKAGSTAIEVPLVQMNALMGFVSDALTATILQLGLDRAVEERTLRAFNRLLWLQNDLIARHYQSVENAKPSIAFARTAPVESVATT